MKRILLIFVLILCESSIYAQIIENECAVGKILALTKRQQNARLMNVQAADINIDVTYYKLNLGLTYSPQNIKGEVTINAKSKTSNLSQITDRKSTRLNSSHRNTSRMPSSA